MTDVMSADGPRALLVDLVERALRSERGVRYNQREHKPTGFYAGRRAAFVASAASLCNLLYGVNAEAAKKTISDAIKEVGEGMDLDANDPQRNQGDAIRIASAGLLAE